MKFTAALVRLGIVAFMGSLLSTICAEPASSRPNILYILADDLGIGDVSAFNSNSAWKTPNIDRLAREGRMFTDAHSASGVCTPSRYTLLTGRYSWRGRLKAGVLNGYDSPLIESNRMTVASFLQSHGYITAMIGKWHLGLDWARSGPKPQDVDFSKPVGGGPTAHGFDTFFGISASLDMPPYVYLENDRATAIPTNNVTDNPAPKLWRAGPIAPDLKFEEVHPRFRERALKFLSTQATSAAAKPFFLYLAFASPHTPVVPTAEFEGKTHTTPYGDFVTQVDATVGEILSALDANNLASKTLVIFTSDNGFAPAADLAALQKINHDPSAGFRGHKADLFEGGHRIPFIARWPGQIPANTRCSQTIGQLDLLATCADILAQKLPPNAGEDSISILPLLRGSDTPPNRPALVHQSNNGSFAIRQGPWKLLFAADSGGWSSPRPNTAETNGLPPLQLYNLATDPSEKTNVQESNGEIVKKLTRQMLQLMDQGRTTEGPNQPFTNPANWPQAARVRAASD
jgi:arylsulfatase A